MEISENNLTNDSVYIGISKEKEQDFTLSNTNTIFELLSTKLYSNKELAVIREIICNAWDAHIENNIQHIPIEITLNESLFSVKDFGKGIDPEKIVEIYCSYGDSSKTTDENQTGGFGLGSKAPFAYTNTFTVVNNHNNISSLYVLNKEPSNPPTIKKIYDKDTEESGLTVNVVIHEKDYSKFYEELQQFLKYSGINYCLNNSIVKNIINIDENNFIADKCNTKNWENNLFIKYGSVIYRIDRHNINPNKNKILEEFFSTFKRYTDVLILQAKPNSLSVTPSRESLLYTEKTIKTVKKRIFNFIFKLKKQFFIQIDELSKNITNLKELFNKRNEYINFSICSHTNFETLCKSMIYTYHRISHISFIDDKDKGKLQNTINKKFKTFLINLFINSNIINTDTCLKDINKDSDFLKLYYNKLVSLIQQFNIQSYELNIKKQSNNYYYSHNTIKILNTKKTVNVHYVPLTLFKLYSEVVITNDKKFLSLEKQYMEEIYNKANNTDFSNNNNVLLIQCNKKHFDSLEKILTDFGINVILKKRVIKSKTIKSIEPKKEITKQYIYINKHKLDTKSNIIFEEYSLNENKVDYVFFFEHLQNNLYNYNNITEINYLNHLIEMGYINNIAITNKISVYNHFIKQGSVDLKPYLYDIDFIIKKNIITKNILNDYKYLEKQYLILRGNLNHIITIISLHPITLKKRNEKLYTILSDINKKLEILKYLSIVNSKLKYSEKHSKLLSGYNVKPNKYLDNLWDKINIDILFKDLTLLEYVPTFVPLFKFKLQHKGNN